jgi:hypothetical protein
LLPAFVGSVRAGLPVPCSFDFNVAMSGYLHALGDGEVPLTLLFSGTVFHEGADGELRVAQIPGEKAAAFRLPARLWREMTEHYYPNSAWLRLSRDVFERLYRYKMSRGLPTWERALEALLGRAGDGGAR